MIEGSATVTINRPVAEVFAAISDITRMGEWSPECTGGRWVDPATCPAVGATFEGDNALRVGSITLRRWTTTSEVTEYVPDKVFELLAEGYSTWRYELSEIDGATAVTESFSHKPAQGADRLVYSLARRDTALVKGMQKTLDRIKAALEV